MLKCKEKGISLSVLKVIRISHDETIIWCVFCKRDSKSITKCISNYVRWEDANNSGIQRSLGMKKRLSGKLSGFIIADFTEAVGFPHLIFSLQQIGQRD